MKHFQLKSMASVTHLLIYILAFLLIWEWLRPVPAVTNTGQIEIFVWFTLASAVLIYLRFPFYITMPALFAGSLYGLHRIFMEGPFLSGEGAGTLLRTFAAEFTMNTGMILNGNFAALTDFFRTFLLFTLLALVCYLLYYWVLYTRRVFFFLICTVAYITILDTFTVVDASQAVIRIVIIGFFILALLHMLNVQDEERAIGRRPGSFISPAWMYTLVTMAGAAVVAGILLPKPEPQWEDPVPFMREIAGIEGPGGGAQASRIGYGVNDERLGGGFEKEEGTAFRAAADGEKYWRGESKDVYTGHGWTSDPTYVESEQIFGSGIDYRMFEEGAELEEGETSIEMDEAADFELIFYPGQPVDVQNTAAEAGGNTVQENEIQFYTDAEGGRIQAESGNAESVRLGSYDLTYEEPVFPMEELRNSSEEDPEDIQEYYLQLPEELPERVTVLAEEIAEEHDSRYETASAVEAYFSDNDFEYETENVAVPEDGEDYVDQFLFETQEGYCDNFSTSMVVMLRSLDIPARWVKGFTAGEEIEELEDGRNLYEIANANAHSWVEVYFPEVGWVPFEPTRGFTNYADFEEPESDPGIDLGEDNSGEAPNIPEPEGGVDDLLEEGGEQEGTDEDPDEGTAVFTLKNLLISIPLIIGVMILYQKQSRLQNKFFFYRYRLSGKSASFSSAYQRLLWMLANEGLPRAEGETLREYSRRVDLALSSRAMTKLTSSYEKVYYGGRTPEGEWEKRKKDWEEIVRLLQA